MKIEDLRIELGHPGIPNNGNFYALKEINKYPEKLALKYPSIKNNKVVYEELSFAEFKNEALKVSKGLIEEGFKTGDRIIILFPVSVELYLTIFACFYIGVVPVFLDVSMGRKQLLQAIKDSDTKGIISIDKVLKFKLFLLSLWGKKCYSLDRERLFVHSFGKLRKETALAENEVDLAPENSALITFTSGTSGIPKGANRTIEILLNQKIVSEYLWPHQKTEIDMPAFPMIVLQNLGCGVSSILPMIDFQNYLSMDPSLIVHQMIEEKVTRFSAQPYFIERISDYILEKNITIESVKSLVVGGAVVSKKLCQKIILAFPKARCHIVYGSTEAEPISHTDMEEFIKSEGRGLLLGKTIDVLQTKIIKTENNPLVDNVVEKGEVGEIILAGPHVIKEYIDNHPANKTLKLKSKDGVVWHRIGDLAYMDNENNLWLVGRISDQIDSSTGKIPCYDLEEELLTLFGNKCAFIDKNKTLFIEGEMTKKLENDLVQYLSVKNLHDFKVHFLKKLPVDQRHFSRVDRSFLRSNY